jgi:hypothetical protein
VEARLMASDIPDAVGYRSSVDMARTLVTYLTDDKVIAQAVRGEFPRGIGIGTIRELRAEHLAGLKRAPDAPHKPHDGYYPHEVGDRAARTSKLFVQALERERAASVERAKAQGALHSPALRKPEIVDQAWDREIEAAWRANTELGR